MRYLLGAFLWELLDLSQKKCLGKMGEVAGAGRTVLIVSHALHAVSTLTTRTLVLESGRIAFDGSISDGLAFYRALQAEGSGSADAYRAAAGAAACTSWTAAS